MLVTTDSQTIDWDEIEEQKVPQSHPLVDFFNTTDFYKVDAIVARPIVQSYAVDGKWVDMMKPREELKKAAWSLHGSYWTHDHPSGKLVESVDEVKGVWYNPAYDNSEDGLGASLFFPQTDSKSKEFIESNNDVSVGFRQDAVLADNYTDAVPSEMGIASEDDQVFAYQTNLLFDHVASVSRGRCSSEEGCSLYGLDAGADSFDTFVSTISGLEEEIDSDALDGVTADSNSDQDSDGQWIQWYDLVEGQQFGYEEDGTVEVFDNQKGEVVDSIARDSIDVDVEDWDTPSCDCKPTCSDGPCSCGLHIPLDEIDLDSVTDSVKKDTLQKRLEDAKTDENENDSEGTYKVIERNGTAVIVKR